MQLGQVVRAGGVSDAAVVGELGVADDLAVRVVGDRENGVILEGLVGGVVAAELSLVDACVAPEDEDLVFVEGRGEDRFGLDPGEPLRPVGEPAGQRGLVEVLARGGRVNHVW